MSKLGDFESQTYFICDFVVNVLLKAQLSFDRKLR